MLCFLVVFIIAAFVPNGLAFGGAGDSTASDQKAHHTACKPSKSRPVVGTGFCIGLEDLDNGKCDTTMEVSASRDCNGEYCCYKVGGESLDRLGTDDRASRQAGATTTGPYQTSASANQGTNQKCGFPSAPPQHWLEIEKQNGAHYGYLALQNSSVRTNPVYYYSNLTSSRTIFPGSTMAARAQNSTGFSYKSPDLASSCTAQYSLYYDALDGRFSGYVYSSDSPNEPSPDNLGYYLYDDYVTFEMFVDCSAINNQTGKCTKPDIAVNTRVRPDQLTATVRAFVDKTVDDVLRPYCYGRADLSEHIWTASKPICSGPPAPDSFIGLARGVRDAINGGDLMAD